MKKKLLSFILAICLIIPCAFALTACGPKKNDPKDDPNKAFKVTEQQWKESINADYFNVSYDGDELQKLLCSDLHTRSINQHSGKVNAIYDDCNPIGLVAGDFGEITSLSKHTTLSASDDVKSIFNGLGMNFAEFMSKFTIPTDGTEYNQTISSDSVGYKEYNEFYTRAITIYEHYAPLSFSQPVQNSSITRSVVIGINRPFSMTFSPSVQAKSDFQTDIANLFGFSDKTEFMNYAQSLANLYSEHYGSAGYEALDNGCFYTANDDKKSGSQNGCFIFPIAIKNNVDKPVLMYLIIDSNHNVSVWVHDIIPATWATDVSSCFGGVGGNIDNTFYCKNMIFVTKPINIDYRLEYEEGEYSLSIRNRNRNQNDTSFLKNGAKYLKITIDKFSEGSNWLAEEVNQNVYDSNISNYKQLINYIKNNYSKFEFGEHKFDKGNGFFSSWTGYTLNVAGSEIETLVNNIKTDTDLEDYSIDLIWVQKPFGSNALYIHLMDDQNGQRYDVMSIDFDNHGKTDVFSYKYDTAFNSLNSYELRIASQSTEDPVDNGEIKFENGSFHRYFPKNGNNQASKEIYLQNENNETFTIYTPDNNGSWTASATNKLDYDIKFKSEIQIFFGEMEKQNSIFTLDNGKFVSTREYTWELGARTYTYSNIQIILNENFEITNITWNVQFYDRAQHASSNILTCTLTASSTPIVYPQVNG